MIETTQDTVAGKRIVTWAMAPGFPPAVIFPFTPAERMGMRNVLEFQSLMYRQLYYFGTDGTPTVDYENSIGEPPQWSEDGLTATIRLKPWKWSNGDDVTADNVLLWVNLMKVKGDRYGEYVPGYFPDNLTAYGARSDTELYFTFERRYSHDWVLYNQFSTITPLPKCWDRTSAGPANASRDLGDVEAVYEFLMKAQGDICDENNPVRHEWATSPIWSVVSGAWKLSSYAEDGTVTFVPNEAYSGPQRPTVDEFRQVPTESDEAQYAQLQRGPDAPGGFNVGYLPLSFAERGTNPLEDAYELYPQTAFCIRYFVLNYNNPTVKGRIFAQKYFRQALQSCLDQDSAVAGIYRGYAYRQNGPVPVEPPTDLISPRQRAGAWPLPFDPAKAEKLLEDHGWDTSVTPAVCVDPEAAGEGIPAGTELDVLLRYAKGRPALTALMDKLRDSAAEAGISIRLEEVYGSILVAEDAPCAPGPDTPCLWEMCCWNGGWVYHRPTGEILFSTDAGGNFGHYSDPEADALIARTVTSDDPEVFYDYQDFIAENVPVIFTPNFPIRLFEVDRRIRGFGPINPFGLINPEYWTFNDE